MIIQNVNFEGKINAFKRAKKDNVSDKITPNSSDKKNKLKKSLIALGILGAIGVGIGISIRKNKKASNPIEIKDKVVATTVGAGVGVATHEIINNIKTSQNIKKEEIELPEEEIVAQEETTELPEEEVIENKEILENKTSEYKPEIINLSKEEMVAQDEVIALPEKLATQEETTELPEEEIVAQEEEIELPEEDNKIDNTPTRDYDAYYQKEKEKISKKIAKATEEYEQRLEANFNLQDRIDIINRNNPDNRGSITSYIRKKQLGQLSKEQICALDDSTIDFLINNPYGAKVKLSNMQILKNMSPEKLIALQQDNRMKSVLYEVMNNDARNYILEYYKNLLNSFEIDS